MTRSYRKNTLRTFKNTLSRFAAVFAIVALGVGFLAGLSGTPIDMKESMERYMDDADFYDLRWLRIDGTGIDLPVVQTPGDNEYYLRRGFDRFYAVGGTLFLDERCSVEPDAPTDNWLIYGHNMRDGSMFGQLVRYRDEAFCQAHPTFTFDTLYETATWQVAAVLDTALGADELPYYTFFDADNKLDWQRRVAAITEKSLYNTGVTPEYGTQLLTLSTCGDTRIGTDARFALLAVRVG